MVRGVVAELRETLYQLRATVSESQDLVDVARDYIARWSNRTGRRDRVLAPAPAGGGCRSRSSRSSGGSSRNRSRTSSDMPMPLTHGSAGGLVMVERSSKFETTGAA